MPRDVVTASEADRDRAVEGLEVEKDAGDRPGGREIRPLPLRAPLLDEERRRGEVGTVVGGLERHFVGQGPTLPPQTPEGGGHPEWGRRDEGLGLASELGRRGIADRMDGEARPATLGAVLR